MKKVNINITEQQIEKLKIINKETGLSYSEIHRRSLDDYILKYDKQQRDNSKN